MATLQSFDAEIQKTQSVVNDMRGKLEASSGVLNQFAQADAKIGDVNFDIENARIQDVINQQKVMEGNIADLIIGLEDATNVFGTEFESMKSQTGWEKFVGIFSKQSAQRMRTERVRNMSLAGNLQELLAKSDSIVGMLKEQKNVLEQRYKQSEANLVQVIQRRKNTITTLEAVQKRIEELNPALLDIENKIAAATDQVAPSVSLAPVSTRGSMAHEFARRSLPNQLTTSETRRRFGHSACSMSSDAAMSVACVRT